MEPVAFRAYCAPGKVGGTRNEGREQTLGAHVLRWLLGVATVLMAALLIWQCVTIYHEGIAPENMGENGLRIHDIYSREIVTAHFASIAWSVWVFLALLAANIIAGKPEQKESLRAPVENQLLMLRARTKETDEIRKVKKQRTGVWCGAAILCLICGGMAGRFLLDWSNFASRDLEVVVRQMVIETFPWIGLAFILLMAAEQWNFRLLMKELELRRSAPKRKPDAAAPEKTTGRNVIRVIIAAAAVALIVLGVMNGGMFDVLVKAINICTECIGLG